MTIFENLLKFSMLTMYIGIKHSFEVLSFAFTICFVWPPSSLKTGFRLSRNNETLIKNKEFITFRK